jgi:aspartate/methionine/tyrosine aminotransferase
MHLNNYRVLVTLLSSLPLRFCFVARPIFVSPVQRPQAARICSMTSSESSIAAQVTAVPTISSKIQSTLDPCVVLMKAMIGQYAAEWEAKGGIFSLAQGVVWWREPTSSTQALISALQEKDSMLHMYGPDEGLIDLRDALQEKIRDENGLEHHQVMVTVGANQAYVNCVLTLVEEQDKCVVFKPYYFNHVMALQMTLPKDCLMVGSSSDDGIPDLKWLESNLRQDSSIKMVTIVNPGNPTGTLLSRDFLQKAVDLCRYYGCWLILDCTYEYFVPRGSRFDGCFKDPHVLHIFSFSKAYALAGYRCGYVTVSRDAHGVYEEMTKVQDTIPIAPSRISQIAALGAMKAGSSWVEEKVATLDTGRSAILKALEPLDQIMGGSGAMYIMGKLKDGSDDQEVARRLVQEFGVAVIPGSFCGSPGWIRVCYANLPPEKCLEAAVRLKKGILAVEEDASL